MFTTLSFTLPFVFHLSSSTHYYRPTVSTLQLDIQQHNDDDVDDDLIPPHRTKEDLKDKEEDLLRARPHSNKLFHIIIIIMNFYVILFTIYIIFFLLFLYLFTF